MVVNPQGRVHMGRGVFITLLSAANPSEPLQTFFKVCCYKQSMNKAHPRR